MLKVGKRGYYFLFCLLEIALFFIFAAMILKESIFGYSFQNYYRETWEEKEVIFTDELTVPKGIYEIYFEYEKDMGGAVCYVQANGALPRALHSDRVRLSAVQDSKSFQIYVNEEEVNLKIVIEPEQPNDFNIRRLTLVTAANSRAYQILCVALKLLIFNIIALVICFGKCNFRYSFEVFGIVIIGSIASLGLLEEYILYGHDLVFHLFRIEGLKDGLLAGNFPVRIQPGWFNGWGYPVSVMYGEGLLLFPALLRLLGVSVQNAYKAYIAAVNLATAAVAYYSFFKISKDRRIALFGSALYTLLPYRLCCIYIRAAVGEYSAMLFLPLVVLGFWYAFEGEKSRKMPGSFLIAPVIGFTGLIQTHVITCFLTAFAVLLFCLINLKKIADRNRLIYLFKIFIITVLVNLWFLVPFFRYMQEDFTVNAMQGMEPAFQSWGAAPAELFAVYWNGTLSTTWGAIATIADKFPKPVGTACLIVLAVSMLMYHKRKLGRWEKKAALCIVFFVLFTFMASTVFPYNEINRLCPLVGGLFAKIQFPYRMLTLAGLFGCLLGVLVMMALSDGYGKRLTGAVIAFIGALAVMQGAQFIYSTLYRGDMCLVYDINAFESNAVFSGEYLYEGSWGPATEGLQTPVGVGARIESYEKNFNTVTVLCKGEDKEAFLLMPLYYYPGYEAVDLHTGEKFTVERSDDNNRICVCLPDMYEGTLQVSFREPAVWRLAEVISAGTIIISVIIICGFNKKLMACLRRKKREMSGMK